MYLSRLILDLQNHLARRDLFSPYEMHRSVLKGFPDNVNGGTGRVLYRPELLSNLSRTVTVLVQSEKKPDWTTLEYNKGYFFREPEYKLVNPEFQENQILHFCVRANPTYRKKEAVGTKGKRLAVLKENDLNNWFLKKSSQSGFMVEDLENAVKEQRSCKNILVITEGKVLVSRPHTDNQDSNRFIQTHHAVWFKGNMIVKAPNVLKEALASGIGSAKAFGFGLLSFAKLDLSI